MNKELEKAIIEYELLNEMGFGDANKQKLIINMYQSIDRMVQEQKNIEGFNCQFIVEFIILKAYKYGIKSDLVDLLIQRSSMEDWTVEVFLKLHAELKKISNIHSENFLIVVLNRLKSQKIQLSALVLHYFYTRPWLDERSKEELKKYDNFNKSSSMILKEMSHYE